MTYIAQQKKYIQNELEIDKANLKKLEQLLKGIAKGHATNNQLSETFLNACGEYTSNKFIIYLFIRNS